MKIITIRQPWADLIVNGSKNIENRSWPTSYRGPVLIHASLNVNRALCQKYRRNPNMIPRGGIVGIVEITDCVTKHRGSKDRTVSYYESGVRSRSSNGKGHLVFEKRRES